MGRCGRWRGGCVGAAAKGGCSGCGPEELDGGGMVWVSTESVSKLWLRWRRGEQA